jgi:hypothetical protein
MPADLLMGDVEMIVDAWSAADLPPNDALDAIIAATGVEIVPGRGAVLADRGASDVLRARGDELAVEIAPAYEELKTAALALAPKLRGVRNRTSATARGPEAVAAWAELRALEARRVALEQIRNALVHVGTIPDTLPPYASAIARDMEHIVARSNGVYL